MLPAAKPRGNLNVSIESGYPQPGTLLEETGKGQIRLIFELIEKFFFTNTVFNLRTEGPQFREKKLANSNRYRIFLGQGLQRAWRFF